MKTLNNNIEEQKVGFDNAKLLKEKGFDVKTHYWFHRDTKKLEYNNLLFSMNNLTENYSAPTQQVAIDWIKINFGIQIFLDYTFCVGLYYGTKIMSPNGNVDEIWTKSVDKVIDGSNTPEEAKEAAINYVLTKLI